MTRREKIFWLVLGAVFVVGFVFLVPACNQGDQQGHDAQQQQCPGNKVAFIAIRQLAEFLDVHNWLVSALFAGLVTLFTWRLWQATNELRVSTDKLWTAGEKQFGLARDDFNATHRPWIPVTKVTLNFGLKWAQGNVLVGLNVFCQNTGNSPAQRVSLAASIFPFLYNEDIPGEMAKLQKDHATFTERQLIEHTLFPGTPELCLPRMLMIPEAKISILKDGNGAPATEMVPVILGSIEYYFPFGERSPHYTPFVYFLWGTTDGKDRLTFKLNSQSVEPDNMILVDIISAGDPT